MKDREVACMFYNHEGSCSKGRGGTFRDACQHCDLYRPIRNGRPRRTDLRSKKMADAIRKDRDTY